MSWFQTRKFPSKRPSPDKIEVFARHCFHSTVSEHKERFSGFSKERCFRNFLDTLDPIQANVTFFFDRKRGPLSSYFLQEQNTYPIVEINEGTEAGSFLRLLDYVETLPLDPSTILYFVEDDYLHRPQWINVLKEGFATGHAEYVTLYDHHDKYTSYPKWLSRVYCTDSCHWRTTPSTTQTFGVLFETLMEDLKIHRKYSEKCTISRDHDKFCALHRKGRRLISCMPGWSTHAEPQFASPCIDWEKQFKK